MPAMSTLERLFCCSPLWQVTSMFNPYALPTRELGNDVLEIGAGNGQLAESLVRANPDVNLVVIDLDPHMVDAAAKRLRRFPNATVRLADATDLPFEAGSFDSVVSALMLHHVLEWQRSLAEADRVLRPGGKFVGYDLVRNPLTMMVHLLDRSPHHLLTPAELATACTELGWRADVRSHLLDQVMTFSATTEVSDDAAGTSGEVSWPIAQKSEDGNDTRRQNG